MKSIRNMQVGGTGIWGQEPKWGAFNVLPSSFTSWSSCELSIVGREPLGGMESTTQRSFRLLRHGTEASVKLTWTWEL